MSLDFVRTERSGSTLLVMIDRAERANALHAPAHRELAAVFDDFDADAALRVAILTGAGERAFCAGNDLKFQAEGGSLERPITGFAGLTKRFGRRKPVIAAVNGVALGGGFETVLACDLAIAVEGARFALPETTRGLAPLAAMHLLPRQLPRKLALGMLIGGLELDARAAERHGLMNEVVEPTDLLPAAFRWAERILRGSPIAIGTCLDVVERSVATSDLATAMEAQYESLDALWASEDFREGPRAFAEKRAPRWTS